MIDRYIKWLLIANGAMFVILTITCYAFGPLAAEWIVVGPQFWLRPWTLFTYMFADTGVINTLFNCLWLWFFARMALEIGSGRQLLVSYLAGGLAGAALFIAGAFLGWCPYPLMGASAAVLGVVCFAATRVPYMRMNLFFIGPISFKWIAIIAVGLSLLAFVGNNPGGALAHIGGAFGGTAYAFILGRSRTLVRHAREARKKSLDELLDKIQRSGYKSLSADERRQLLDYSKKL